MVIAFASLLAAFGNQGWVRLYKLRQFEKTLREDNLSVASNNEDLRAEIRRLKDSKYLARYIRQQIGFIRDNELIYEFVDESGKK